MVTSQESRLCYDVTVVEMRKQCSVCVVRRLSARRICKGRKNLRLVLVERPELCPASFSFPKASPRAVKMLFDPEILLKLCLQPAEKWLSFPRL
jgi:hypothetical protein